MITPLRILEHSYSAMLRLQKRYHFGLHSLGSDEEEVPGSVITFTSYPGTIHSQDDFYQISSSDGPVKLTVSGITIKNLNQSLWARAHLTDQVEYLLQRLKLF